MRKRHLKRCGRIQGHKEIKNIHSTMLVIMLPQKSIDEIVMRRVQTVYCMRQLVYPVLFEFLAIGSVTLWLLAFDSIKDIIANVKIALVSGSFFQYVLSGFARTEISMQVLICFGLIFSVYFVYRTVRTVRFFSSCSSARTMQVIS